MKIHVALKVLFLSSAILSVLWRCSFWVWLYVVAPLTFGSSWLCFSVSPDVNILWFAEVRGIMNRRHVQEGYDQVQQALLDYTVNCYPQIQVTYSSICWAVLELFTSPKGFTLVYTDKSLLNADNSNRFISKRWSKHM
jgi:hypothetical protein